MLAVSGAVTAAYGTVKAALEHATRALAVEWGPRGIRVNSVAPGFVETAMTEVYLAAYGAAVVGLTPLRQLVGPRDVATVAAFLLSDTARLVTGPWW